MDCDKYLELMSAALDGELTADERRELDSHLAVCPECADLFHALSANAKAMRELDCEVPAGLKDRIMSNLPQQKKVAEPLKPKNGKVIHWKRWAPVAAAACLALVVALVPKGGMSMNSAEAPQAYAPTADAPRSPGAAPMPSSEMEHYIVSDSNSAAYGAEPSENLQMGGLVDPAEPTAQEPNPDGSMAPETTAPIGTQEHELTISLRFENQRSIRLRHSWNMPETGAVIIGSAKSLNEYLNQFKSYLGQELSDVSEDLQQLQNNYGYDQFFEGECLLMIRVDAPSGGDRLRIADGRLFRDSVILEQTADGATFDMGHWLIVAEVSANFFEDGDTLKVSIDKAYDRYYPIQNIWLHRVGISGRTSSETTVIQSVEELTEYLETNVYYTDRVTGELVRIPELEDLVSMYGTPIPEWFFESRTLLAFVMGAPVTSPKYEVLTVNGDAVTVRQDHYFYGSTCPSTWLLLVEAHGEYDPDNPPKLVVENGYP